MFACEAALTKRTGGSSSLCKSTKLCENLLTSSPELLDGLKTQTFLLDAQASPSKDYVKKLSQS